MVRGGISNADLIVRALRAAGVSHGFGIPSGNVLPLVEAMRSSGDHQGHARAAERPRSSARLAARD